MNDDREYIMTEILKLEEDEELILFRGTKGSIESLRASLERSKKELPAILRAQIILKRMVIDKDDDIHELRGCCSKKGKFNLIKVSPTGEKENLPSFFEVLEKERVEKVKNEDNIVEQEV